MTHQRAPFLAGVMALVVLAAPASGADGRAPRGRSRAAAPRAPLTAILDRIADAPAFAAAFWGLEVRSLRSGKSLYSRNAGKDFAPASTFKMLTTAAALDVLGPETRLRTSVVAAARMDAAGILADDLYLVGGGDPTLTGSLAEPGALEELADALRTAGLRKVTGRVVGEEGLFTGERRGHDWTWEDLVWWYGAEVSALSVNNGCAVLRVEPGAAAGEPVRVDRRPASAYFVMDSQARTGPAGGANDLVLRRNAGGNRIELSGTYPVDGAPVILSVALEDPARYAATVFAEVLRSKGIEVIGAPVTSSAPPIAGRVLAAHDSVPLAEILKGVNKPSQNLHAETLLRLLGAGTKGDGSVEAGEGVLQEFLGRLGVDTSAWALVDGSGLARSDLVTPAGLVSFLAAMDRHPHAEAFRASLPVAGADGTLQYRLRGTAAEGRIVAKTGSFRHVHSLAGYADTRSGDRLAFAILVNHHSGDPRLALAAIDQMAEALAGY